MQCNITHNVLLKKKRKIKSAKAGNVNHAIIEGAGLGLERETGDDFCRKRNMENSYPTESRSRITSVITAFRCSVVSNIPSISLYF